MTVSIVLAAHDAGRTIARCLEALSHQAGIQVRDSTGGPTAEDDEAVLGSLADQIRGGLSVAPVRTTQLVQISFRSSSPEFAAKAANGFAEAFIDMGVEDRFATAGKASSFGAGRGSGRCRSTCATATPKPRSARRSSRRVRTTRRPT